MPRSSIRRLGLLAVLFAPLLAVGIQAQDFRVVGYLPTYRFDLVDQLDLSQLTHLNLSFANPNSSGDLVLDGEFASIVERAHEEGVDVFVALAGGFLPPAVAEAWKVQLREENRGAFIHRIVQFVETHQLQGVDVDLEWEHVDSNYTPFALALQDSLEARGLQATAAWPGTTRYAAVTDEVIDGFEWINLMAYDLTGGWAPGNPGPHSPYSFATASIAFWRAQGVEPERMSLGVPFYGYDFSDPTSTVAMTFASIVEADTANASRDQVGSLYYNGIGTIARKTELALSETGGIMIWEIGQDAPGDFSLLATIGRTIAGVQTGIEASSSQVFRLYPNPVTDILTLRGDFRETTEVEVVDILGRVVRSERIGPGSTLRLDLGSEAAGMYFVRWSSSSLFGHASFIKR